MAAPFTTGPAHMFVGTVSIVSGVINVVGTPLYIGTSAGNPQIEHRPVYEGVPNDLSGAVPLDLDYLGEDAIITADFTRWNEPVLAALRARPRPGFAIGGGNTQGVIGPLDIGSLVIQEGSSFALWMMFPFFQKPVYQALGMPPGFRYIACTFEGPDTINPGTRYGKRHAVFHALPFIDKATGKHFLYDTNFTGVSLALVN